MSPVNVTLSDLIADIDNELADSDELAKIGEAQLRSLTLADLGDQLIGHYVARAREAGISWSQIGDAIGVSKQGAQQRWMPSIFERYTDRARHVVVRAQETARSKGHDHINPGHLILALLDESDGLSARVVTAIAGSTEPLREKVEKSLKPGTKKRLKGHLPLTPQTKAILEQASKEALKLQHNYVGTEHLLLGLIAIAHTDREAPILDGYGLTYDAVRQRIEEMIAAILAERAKQTPAE